MQINTLQKTDLALNQSANKNTAPALSIQGITKDFPKLQALKGVDLTIAQGEFFGLLGPNGAGKTTLISIIAGLAKASSGTVSVMGHDVQKDFRAARKSLGLVPQELVFDPFFTVKEFLRNQSGYFGIKNNDVWIDEMLDGLGLADKANANMRALSGGMKRRVLIAQALVHKPAVIVLDEPTAGVDVELRQTLWKFIRKLHAQGHTIVLTTHYLEEAEELCGRIAMLQQGKIVALDTTANLLGQFAGLQLMLRINGVLPDVLKPLLSQGTGSVAGERLRLRLSHYDATADILATLRSNHLIIEELEVQRADLEDVFLQIMNGQNAPVKVEY
jgi:ABC-2 type transport system ATP-binding protein